VQYFIERKGHGRKEDKVVLSLTEGICCMSRFHKMCMLDVLFTLRQKNTLAIQ